MSELRVSDADRDLVADRLRAAAGEGRLSAEELEERLDAAFAAKTEGDLAPLTADLPAPAVDAPGVDAPARRARRSPAPRAPSRLLAIRPDFRPYVGVSVMLVAIWALTGMGYFWPIWPILGWGSSFVFTGSLRGPCRRRSSNPGSSTGRWPSSAAAGPGSGERPR
jgi:Domain of unknown function (DUF1707)